MTTNGKMSYKDYIFPVNPSVIRISHSRKIAASKVPNGYDNVSDLGAGHRIISGEGEFYGKDCINDFIALKAVMDRGGGGMLYLPSQSPIYAMFEKLELIAGDIDGVIRYSFIFAESFENNHKEHFACCFGNNKDCLWDISYQYGIHIDVLTEFNQHIKRPDIPIRPWEKVKLC